MKILLFNRSIRLLIFIAMVIVPFHALAQNAIKILNPVMGVVPDLSPERQKMYVERDAILKKDWDKLTPREKGIIRSVGEVDSIWDIEGSGCSWYCGGGPESVTASSSLPPSGGIDYKADNAHDLSYKNAWVEGAEGYGIGEYLEYTFQNRSPRITTVRVFNGYVKSDKLWKANSRVKKLKMYVDGTPYAILNIKDTKTEQRFNLGEPLGRRPDGKDLIVRFEIMEVYKGTKYKDTVITELLFDGIDVHCFAKGTMVLMGDGVGKPVEDLKAGDTVMSLSGDRVIKANITGVERVFHDNLVQYLFEGGVNITSTRDHPFMISGKGWSSLDPDASGRYEFFQKVSAIEIGDLFVVMSDEKKLGELKLVGIEPVEVGQETYTISGLSIGNSFIANGLVVGVETLK